MKKEGQLGRHIYLAAVLLILSATPFLEITVMAAEGREPVRIGFYEMEGFQEYDELGNPIGYNVDYLSRISAITGWEYEYVEINDFIQGTEMLERKEIDLLAPCQMTAERMDRFTYCDYPFGTEYTALVTTAGNNAFSYDDCENFNGMTVAAVKDYLLTDRFMEYTKEKNFEINIKYYKTPKAALIALENGRADAAVANLMMIDSKYKVLARFGSAPFYYMTWRGNDELLEELNAAMRDLKNNYAGLENQLNERYFPIYNEQYFSGEEEEYIASLGKIKVSYAPGRLPVSFTNEETGELDGITRDILDRIQEVSGLEFEYVELPYGPVTYDYLRDHDITLVSGAEYNSANMNIDGVWISNPYLSTKKVIVSRDDMLFDRNAKLKIAIATGSQTIKSVITAKYPNFEIVDYNDIGSCFEAVKDGEADILMLNQYVVEDWLSRPRYETLGIVPVEGLDDELCFAIMTPLKGGEQEGELDYGKLISILNKAISQISQDEVETMIVKEAMTNKYTYTFADFCYKYKYALTIASLMLFCAVWVWIYISHIKKKAMLMRKEEEDKLLLQQRRYQLIMEKSEEIIYEISLCGGACLVSDKMKEKFGWSFPEQIKNPSVDKLMESWRVHPDDQKKLRESLISMIDENNSSESLIRMQRLDGEYIWCKVARFPLLDNDNILVSIVGKIADVDSEVREKEKLELQSRTDGLTSLLNKKTFMDEAKQYLSRNTAVSSAVIFVDLDYFKDVNDKLGHIVGDKAIKDAAKKLRVIFAGCDLVARFGGDEFCIFLKNISKSTLEDKLGWAVDKLKETYTDGASIVKVSASIGAIYCTKAKADFKELLDEADRALYTAKDRGRNQFVLKEK